MVCPVENAIYCVQGEQDKMESAQSQSIHLPHPLIASGFQSDEFIEPYD